MLSRSIKNLTSNQLVTRTITTSSTLPRKVYQRTTTNKLNSTTLKPTSTTTTASTTSPIAKKVTKPVLTESTVIPEVKSTPNWSSADEFDHQLEFSSSSSSSNQETIVDPLPEIPSRTTRSTPAASSSVIPALTEFPNAPFPSASSINLSTPLAPLHSNHSNLARASTPLEIPVEQKEVDWTTSFHGISSQPFSREAAEKLMRPLVAAEIEIKPGKYFSFTRITSSNCDTIIFRSMKMLTISLITKLDGLLYLPEILYRRILNQAFGPGGWGMVPRGEMTVLKMMVSREWGLVANGR